MLVVQPKKSTIEKVFRTETGEFIRATFLVVEWEGQIRARLIKTEIISDAPFVSKEDRVALPQVECVKKPNYQYKSLPVDFVSPYVELSFFLSQPTRAPSL